MSSTRHNLDGAFKQEKFCSSPLYDRCLKANLVAARLSVGCSPEMRETIWFLQYLSLKPGGLHWAGAELAPCACAVEDREEWLATLCLDPESNLAAESVLPSIREMLANYARQVGGSCALTEVFVSVQGALDYTSAEKTLTVVSGRPRIGKTHVAKHWVDTHPGRARFVEVPSGNDDLSFFMALARALGIAIPTDAKRKYIQPKIEATLRGGDLVLVMDEAANLYPARDHRQHARPPRISWVMEMINRGVPIALLVTPNFFANAKTFTERTGWNDAQFWGRVGRFVELPNSLELSGLEAVARCWMPYASQKIVEVLADAANLSRQYLSAISHAVKLAEHYARQAGRDRAEWPDVRRAISNGLMPGDDDLALALNGAGARRNIPASLAR